LRRIKVHTEVTGWVLVELIDKNPKTAEAIWKALPFESVAQTWGEEVYFEIPVELELENPQTEVEVGDVGYWPPEHCMCIFFGKTPFSKDDKPVAYSPVNVFGRVVGDPKIFSKVKDGDRIRVEKA